MLKRSLSAVWLTFTVVLITLVGLLNATATELRYFQTFTNVDYASAGVGGLREVGRGTINLTGVSGTVKKAYLYWHGHGHPNDYDPNRTTGSLYFTDLANPSAAQMVVGDLIGTSGSDGWAFDPYNLTIGQAFRADVTGLVLGNGSFFVSNFDPFGLTVQGASLIVIFDDSNPNNNRDIVIADGCDQNSINSFDAAGWNISFPGVNYAIGDAVEMEFHVSDGQTQYLEAAIFLNGQLLAPTVPIISTKPNSLGQFIGQIFDGSAPYNTSSGFRKSFFTGSLWDIKSFNIVPLLLPGVNNLYITSGYEDDDLTVVALIAKLKSGASVGGQVENSSPVVTCSGAVNYGCATSRGVTNVTQATISDPDGDPLTLTWRLNGAIVGQISLPAGGSMTPTTYSVTNVLLLGTYDISAVVQDIKGATTTCDSIALVEVDTTPPVVDGGPAITVAAGSNGQAPLPNVLGQVVASDLCTSSDQLQYSQSIPAGTLYAPGTYQITVTVADANGNVGSGVVLFTVLAATPPPSNLTVNCPPDASITKVESPVFGACTFSQGGWGTSPSGNNSGSILANYFSKVYPKGYVECGISGYLSHSLKLTSPAAIRAFLPRGGSPGSLSSDCKDSTSCSGGIFAGQVLTLQLNVDFGDANISGFKSGCGDYVFHDSASKCDGKTVRQILALCNSALSGWNLFGCSIAELNTLCDNLNQAFDCGRTSAWCLSHLSCPAGGTPVPSPNQTGTATINDTCDTNPVLTYSDVIKPGDCAGAYTVLRTWIGTDACGNTDNCTQVISVGTTKSSLCGNVLLDTDGGGRLCFGGAGLSGVTITVKDSSNAVLDTTKTDASGGYCFFGLPAGTYTIVVTPPTGYKQTGGTATTHWQDNSGRDCWKDNDGNTHWRNTNDRDSDGRGRDCWTGNDGYIHWRDDSGRDCWQDNRGYTHSQFCNYIGCDLRLDNAETVTIKACEAKSGVNFSYTIPCKSSVCGNVFLDVDGSGDLSRGDSGLVGSIVTLKDSHNNTVASSPITAAGTYCFTGLLAGSYSVVVLPPAGYKQTGGTTTAHWLDGAGRDCWRDNDGFTHFRDRSDRETDSSGRGKDCWTANDGYSHWRDSSGRDCWQDSRGYAHTQPCGYTSCDSRLDNSESITLKPCETKTGLNFAYTGNQCKAVVTVTGPGTAKCGDIITYTCTLVNIGTASFSKGCQLNCLGGAYACTTLKPGASYSFPIKYKVKSSDYGSLPCQISASCSSYAANSVSVQSSCTTQIKR